MALTKVSYSMITGAVANVMDFGAVGNGIANDTAAFQAAVDSLTNGGTVFVPKGTYLLDSVNIPHDPITVSIIGDGTTGTILQMNDPTKPVIQCLPSATPHRTTGSTFANFGVKANASGSYSNINHVAILCESFSQTMYKNLRFYSNGSGSVHTFILVNGNFTYDIHLEELIVAGETGPAFVVRTSDNGGGVFNNPNLVYIRKCWVYANSHMTAAFDMSCCTKYTVEQSLVESTGTYGAIVGSQGRIADNWFESQTTSPLQFQAGTVGTTTSAGNLIEANYFSGFSGAFTLPSGCSGNTFSNNGGGAYTYSKNTADYLNITQSNFPAFPVVTQNTGGVGTLSLTIQYLANKQTGTMVLVYGFTPAGPGNANFLITPPTGFSIATASVSVVEGSLAQAAYAAGIAYPLNNFFVTFPNTNPCTIVVQCTLQ